MHHPGTPSFCSSDSLPRLAGQSSISSVATPVSSAILSSADVKFSRLGPHQIDLPSKTNLAGAYHHRCMFIRPPSSLQDAPELPEDTKGLPMNLLVFQHLHRSPTAIGSNAVADQGHRVSSIPIARSVTSRIIRNCEYDDLHQTYRFYTTSE
ncbi:uncharacterized protein LOC119354620 [Triticum dicoccoides]|uniref:uncharacterized protein LOC119354620 n=1 Tax=Triticum dicoccoides TaxID=85692 RepID=UPI00188F3C6B|nr:uncharacterized protein LOC119354620 [Triticum dicoccoides]